jgi:hypothetical protein
MKLTSQMTYYKADTQMTFDGTDGALTCFPNACRNISHIHDLQILRPLYVGREGNRTLDTRPSVNSLTVKAIYVLQLTLTL